ncbi:MAG: hypothetical protein ACLTZY_05175 [Alistipes indistinctus]
MQIVNLDGNTSYETVPISKNQPVVPLIEKPPACGEIHPYAIKAGILRGEEAMQGVVLKGVGPDYDWSFFRENLSGRFDSRVLSDSVRNKDVLISHRLASMLKLRVGDPLEMLFIQNPPRRDRFRVKGIYDTQFDELDKVMVLTDIRNVQRLNGWDSTQITRLRNHDHRFSPARKIHRCRGRADIRHPARRRQHAAGDQRPRACTR